MISEAYAQGAQQQGPDQMLWIMLIFMAVFFFLVIRPQMKRAKEQKNMLEALQKGDEVVIGGGVAGKITKVGDQYIKLEIATDTEINVQKSAIQTLLPKGTLKSL